MLQAQREFQIIRTEKAGTLFENDAEAHDRNAPPTQIKKRESPSATTKKRDTAHHHKRTQVHGSHTHPAERAPSDSNATLDVSLV